MLVLSRFVGQKIYIPKHNIEIEVVSIRPHKVRIGFTAPGDVEIVRDDAKNQSPRPPKEVLHEFRADEGVVGS